jgi:uncharacterized ferredoxin-like protein
MFTQILFGAKAKGSPLKCYKVGIMGCTEIKEKLHGKDENGLDIASCIIRFDDLEEVEVSDTLSVE